MTEYFFMTDSGRLSRSRSLCHRCGGVKAMQPLITSRRKESPGRTSYFDRSRRLNLEMDGREGRDNRRRHNYVDGVNGADIKRQTSMHCYVLPVPDKGKENEKSVDKGLRSSRRTGQFGSNRSLSTTTYRESFRSPPKDMSIKSRYSQSVPATPITMSPARSTAGSPRFGKTSLAENGGPTKQTPFPQPQSADSQFSKALSRQLSSENLTRPSVRLHKRTNSVGDLKSSPIMLWESSGAKSVGNTPSPQPTPPFGASPSPFIVKSTYTDHFTSWMGQDK